MNAGGNPPELAETGFPVTATLHLSVLIPRHANCTDPEEYRTDAFLLSN